MVDELKAKGWVFAYIGANQDVEKVAASISISNTLCFNSTPDGTRHMSSIVNKSRVAAYCKMYSNFDSEDMNENFFDSSDQNV